MMNVWMDGLGMLRDVGGWFVAAGGDVVTSAQDRGVLEVEGPDSLATTLLATGVILLILEIKIVSKGILGLLGTLCMVVATGFMWRDGGTFWGVPVIYMVPVIGVIIVVGAWLAVLAAQAHNVRVVSGMEGFVGEEAVAAEDIVGRGRVFFQGSYWQAESVRRVGKGERVRIVSANKLKLVVEPVDVGGLDSGEN